MRRTHAAVLLGILWAAGANALDSAAPQAARSPLLPSDPECLRPPVTMPVTITFAKNPYPGHVGADRCDVSSVDPHIVRVCPGDTIQWTFANGCDADEKVQIGARTRLYPKGVTLDPIKEGTALPLQPATVKAATVAGPVTTPGTFSVMGTVDPAAEKAIYKYWIGGTIPVDPEIEVRRGGGRRCPPTCQPTPSQSETPPSPGAKH